jgi:hypothetical protein
MRIQPTASLAALASRRLMRQPLGNPRAKSKSSLNRKFRFIIEFRQANSSLGLVKSF